jgi:pimeloyl-ACP methyl ester carboxylesterase
MMIEKTLITKDVIINYAEAPSPGPDLILLHGIPGRWQEFLPIMPDLAFRYHLFALDFRGQGKSSRTAGEYHSKSYGKDILSFLNHEFEEPVILFGMSAGGLVALDVAAQAPGRVKAVIVGDSPIDIVRLKTWMKSEEFMELFSAFRDLAGSEKSRVQISNYLAEIQINIPGEQEPIRYADQPGVDALELRQFAKTLSMLDPGVLDYHAEGRADEYLAGFDLEKMLPNITCPVLLVQGNPNLGGMMTNESVANALAELPDATTVLIEGAGHDLLVNTWKERFLLRAIFTFLDTLE